MKFTGSKNIFQVEMVELSLSGCSTGISTWAVFRIPETPPHGHHEILLNIEQMIHEKILLIFSKIAWYQYQVSPRSRLTIDLRRYFLMPPSHGPGILLFHLVKRI
jgi:hypothetical protein